MGPASLAARDQKHGIEGVAFVDPTDTLRG